MNAGLLTSYIVAGILIISIISMNNSVTNSSSEISFSQTTREKLSSISETFANDIQKIGFNRTAKTETILQVANNHKIKFHSNIDNSTDNSVEVVTWEFTTSEVTSTSNPNDYVLMRTVVDKGTGSIEEETPIELGVTEFNIAYYNNYGAPISDSLSTPLDSGTRDQVKQFYIKLKLESPQKIYNGPHGEGRYISSVWEKRFSPPNLQTN